MQPSPHTWHQWPHQHQHQICRAGGGDGAAVSRCWYCSATPLHRDRQVSPHCKQTAALQHCSPGPAPVCRVCHRAPVLARCCRMIWHLVTLYCSSYGTEVGPCSCSATLTHHLDADAVQQPGKNVFQYSGPECLPPLPDGRGHDTSCSSHLGQTPAFVWQQYEHFLWDAEHIE